MRGLVKTDWGFYTVMDLADDEFGGPQGPSADYRPKTLARVIEGEKALPLKECVRLALSLAKGLDVLQRHHLLHRDIKPGNVLYVGGCPVLSDPGLIVEESEAASLVGTPGYVPPEKFTDAASDIYSLGLTLKAASFGRQLEDLDKGPALEADTGAKLFPAWWRILNKATDPTPSRRYQSAKALARDLKLLGVRLFFSSRNSRKNLIVVFLAKFLLVALVLAVALLYLGRSNAQNGRKRDNAANARAATVYERALRENFGDILSEEQIKEKSRKAAAGEDIGLAPAETKAYMKKLGLDKIKTDLKELSEKLERNFH
jgi:serine/threonine-protein kinase